MNASLTTDSDTDSTTLTYRWDVDGDGYYDEDVTGQMRPVSWAELMLLGIDDGPDGPRTVTVEVSDGTNVDTASTTLTVNNSPPTLQDVNVTTPITEGAAASVNTSG